MKRSLLLAVSLLAVHSLLAESRGLAIIDPNGEPVTHFSESYALVIGESRYTAGWQSLPGVQDDTSAVEGLLAEQGFSVEVVKNANSDTLRKGIETFFNSHGYDRDVRLLIYYAGHGHTLRLDNTRDMGYIVPTDAPLPNSDQRGFMQKAIPMQQFETWSKQIVSRHVLFIFDSCFSGSVFSLRAGSVVPPIIDYKIANPVRQFISSGAANESVPDVSIFRRQLERALRDGDADTDRDGYVSGTELGSYLQSSVVNYTPLQHPQYGKIRDPDLDRGDFVFAVGHNALFTPPKAPPSVLRPLPNEPNQNKSNAQKFSDNAYKFWSVGANVGSSFAAPWIVGTIHGTIAPFKYSFFDVGIDLGAMSRVEDAKYFSIYPFVHYNFFLPFGDYGKGGFYTGIGAGLLSASYTFPGYTERLLLAGMDAAIGVTLFDMFDIAYTMRTSFKSVNHKVAVGYSYRFRGR